MAEGQPSWRGLYAILDLPHAGGLEPVAAARALVGGSVTEIGAKILQLRAKRAPSAGRTELVRALLPVVRAAGALLIVDDDIDAAMLADGVHLGQEDLAALAGGQDRQEALAGLRRRVPPNFLIGLSTHDRAQVLRAAGLPVDYIGFGPILPTRSKANPDPWVGMDELRTVCEISSHPVVAIGGLAGPDALTCVRVGAAAAAMIGALAGASVAEVRERAASLASALRTAADR
jgi:thiamine-phosphate pyrophosphorylase